MQDWYNSLEFIGFLELALTQGIQGKFKYKSSDLQLKEGLKYFKCRTYYVVNIQEAIHLIVILGKNIENMLSNKKTSKQYMTEREEIERRKLQKVMMENRSDFVYSDIQG